MGVALALTGLASCDRLWPPRHSGQIDLSTCAGPGASPRLSFRFVVDQPTPEPYPGADVLKAVDGRLLTVRRTVRISGWSIRNLQAWYAQDRPEIAIQFDAEGARQLKIATTAVHRGEMLALVIGDTVVAAAQIADPVDGPMLMFPTNLDTSDTERLAAQLREAAPLCRSETVGPPESTVGRSSVATTA